jgi:hypothetical protein
MVVRGVINEAIRPVFVEKIDIEQIANIVIPGILDELFLPLCPIVEGGFDFAGYGDWFGEL